MILIKHVAVYVCILQVINRQLTGILAATISINQNITRILGSNDTKLTCSFVQEKNEKFLSLEIIAKNKADNFDKKKPIATFHPDRAGKLYPSGTYLSGRVSLTNITHTSTYATLKFHVLKCTDEKDYMCKYYSYDKDGALVISKSATTRILVKVPVRHVHINNNPNQTQYDRKTDNITLTCKASGDPEPTYKWFKENNNDTIISRTRVYVIDDVIRNNSGVYICEAHNIIENVYYRQSNAVKINIVDEMLILPDPASSSSSSEHVAYTVPVILVLVVVVIVSFLVVRKRLCKGPTKEKSSESRWQNMLRWFNRRHGSDKNPSYAVVDKQEPGDGSNGLKVNENICKNNEKVSGANCDISPNLPNSLDNIYAVPCDIQQVETVTSKIGKDRERNGNKGVSEQDAVYSEVFIETNMNYEISKEQTSEHPDTVDHNGDGVFADQCHV